MLLLDCEEDTQIKTISLLVDSLPNKKTKNISKSLSTSALMIISPTCLQPLTPVSISSAKEDGTPYKELRHCLRFIDFTDFN